MNIGEKKRGSAWVGKEVRILIKKTVYSLRIAKP